MALLDVNALVALAWDSHVHHAPMRARFGANRSAGWATCAVTESGFVRVSSNLKLLPTFIAAEAALGCWLRVRALAADVSLCDSDVPRLAGYRQVTDAQRLTLARRHGSRLVTFDAGIVALAEGRDVELLSM